MRWIDDGDADLLVVGNALRSQAEAIGDDVFLMGEDRRLSYVVVNDLANRYAHGLADLGVSRGDTVSILMTNSVDLVLVALAVNKLGAAWVPSNTANKGEWLRNNLDDGRAELLVTDLAHVDRVTDLGDDLPIGRAVVLGLDEADRVGSLERLPFAVLDSGKTDDPGVRVDRNDLSAVMWTSGTTGRSKGVMQSHGCWLTNASVLARSRGPRPGDAFYCCVPLFNSGGWSLNTFSALVSGLPIGIDAGFSVTEFWDRCRLYGASHILTLGAMHMFLWQAPPRDDDALNPVRLGACVPLPHELVGPFKERFGIEQVWQGFGQSEMMGWTLCDSSRDDWQPNSCGIVRPDLEVKLLDEDDREVPTGSVGEVCVRPRRPGVMFSGYFHQPEVTLQAFRNLWYHSGDLARFDEGGELYFVDRTADYMRFGGRNVASFDVERAVASHPDVIEVAAHGVPSAELESETEVKVCVILREGATVTEEELARHVNANAPHFLVPRYIEFVDDLPHTPTGRVQKFLLRERGLTEGTWDRVAAGYQVEK